MISDICNHKKSLDNMLIVLWILVAAKLLIHFFTNTFAGYGIFRDELYYLACSNRLALGYVDQPPLSIYILKLSRFFFGQSVFAIRMLPAIAGAMTVFFTGLLVKRMGGRVPAVTMAGLSVIIAPIFMGMNTIYSMNSFDILLWTLAAYLVVLIIQESSPRLWLMLGLVLGLGLLNKISMFWFGTGLALALLLTENRRNLTSRWPYLAAILAFVIFSPFIVWNLSNDFAHLEFIRNATQVKYASVSRIDFLMGQLVLLHPFTVPVWLGGLYFYFFNKEGKRFKCLGIIFLTVLLILLINGSSKPEYLAAAFPLLFAAGGVQLEKLFSRKKWSWFKYGLPVLFVAGGIVIAPLALPCLPIQTFISYSQSIGMGQGNYEGKEMAQLPQFYADMFGWEEMAKSVSRVYAGLSLEEKKKTLVFARNYGEAGAIEYFSEKYELPPVVSPHNNYWIWWGREHLESDIETLIIMGGDIEDYLGSLVRVEPVGVSKCRYCMPYENNMTIFVGREFKRPITEIRQFSKNFY